MALFTRGNLCSLCGEPMERRRDIIVFPYLVSNIHDPLFMFSGGVFHKTCVSVHPWGKMAVRQKQFVHETILPNKRKVCVICKTNIAETTQLVTTGILTSDVHHPLFRFNWLEAHKRCCAHWRELPVLVSELQRFIKSGQWADFNPEYRSVESLLETIQPLVPGRAESLSL